MQLFLLETIILFSIITSRASQGSILKSTQVGTLVQHCLLAFYYLVLGRFPIDIFHTNGRNVNKDWIIYLCLLVAISLIYVGMVCLSTKSVSCRKGARGVHDWNNSVSE